MLDRMRYEMYWSYYLSIENMLKNTSQYVSPSKENSKTYSDEFAKIILLSCSEIDSILKLLCKLQGINYDDKKYNMNVYADVLEQLKDIHEIAYCPSSYTSINENALIVFPFAELNKGKRCAGLEWWNDYQLIKHNRLENAEHGSLYNAVSAVAAQYILLRFLIDFLDEYSGKDYVREHNWSEYLVPCV